MADIAFEKDLSVAETGIEGLKVVDLAVHGDSRGWFKENWQRAKMTALGIPDLRVVQNNISYNDSRGVTRGIHAEPWDKFISVARGSVFGAWVDLREGSETFGKVYIMLGINELGNDLDDITAKFSSLIDTVRAAQPNAIVYVEANLHVGPSRSSTDATFNNPRIDRLNEKLAALADGKDIFYIDINEVFDDENGNLRADASGDSTHVYAKYDLDWCDWLRTKAIVR